MNRQQRRLAAQSAQRAAKRRPAKPSAAQRLHGYQKAWSAADLEMLFAPLDEAEKAMLDGSMNDDHIADILAAIQMATAIAKKVQRHNHLLPDMYAANTAASLGNYGSAEVRIGIAIYRAIIPATGREVVRDIMAQELKKAR